MPIDKPRAGGKWTEARFWGFIRSNLRRAQWPPLYQVKEAAQRKYTGDNPRQKYEYQCAICKGWFKGSETQVDHIKPCGSLKSFDDLPKFVETLYCEADNLRVLCKGCHQDVTNKEREKK